MHPAEKHTQLVVAHCSIYLLYIVMKICIYQMVCAAHLEVFSLRLEVSGVFIGNGVLAVLVVERFCGVAVLVGCILIYIPPNPTWPEFGQTAKTGVINPRSSCWF